MFGISFEELIVLLVLALILFGPEKLPEYGAKMGQWLAKLRQASTEFSRSLHTYQYPESPPPLPQSLCPQCGQKLGQDFVFCPQCGHRLAGAPETKPPLAS